MNENTMRRLRAANLIEAEGTSNEGLFAQIVALPNDRRLDGSFHLRARRLRPQFVVVTGLAALVLCAAAWAATGFHFDAFDGGSSASTPAALRAAFIRAYQGDQAIDPESIATMGTFTTSAGEIAVNVARAADGNGFVTQYVDDDGKAITYMGEFLSPSEAGDVEKRLVVSSNSLNGMFDGVWQLWGMAPADTARLALRFQDGAVTNVPLHDGLFVYLFGGTTCQPGHQPLAFVATDNSGSTIDKIGAPRIDC